MVQLIGLLIRFSGNTDPYIMEIITNLDLTGHQLISQAIDYH